MLSPGHITLTLLKLVWAVFLVVQAGALMYTFTHRLSYPPYLCMQWPKSFFFPFREPKSLIRREQSAMFTHTSPNLTPSRVVHIVHIVENLITGEMSDIDMLKRGPIFSDKLSIINH